MTPVPRFGVWRVTRFYVPLLMQAFSQCLTYPLVAGIVSHGVFGVDALTAFSQGQMIMFMIGSLGGGLVMTGMVFAKSREGYLAFRSLNARMMAALLLVQCIPALPPFDRWLFEGFFALPPSLARVAALTLLGSIVSNALFFLRNVPIVVLLNNLESGKCNTGTFLRVVFTVVLAVAFPRFGLTGPYWGLLALTLGVALETGVTWLYARPYVRALKPEGVLSVETGVGPQLRFTLPLSLGGFLLSVSPLLVAAFVGRTENATDMLAIHYVTLGVANPVSFAALKMQAVSIEFPPESSRDRRLLFYAVASGASLGVIPFAFSLPCIGEWYFGVFQNVPPRILDTVRLAIGLYSFICIIHAVRGRAEGLAALAKRPAAVMAGQIGYTVALLAVLATLLPFGVPGWAMAVTAVYTAPVFALIAVYAVLRR